MSAALSDLLRGYASLVPPQNMPFPTHLPFADVHDFILHSILLNSRLQQFPPSDVYQSSFWKWVIARLEALIGDEDAEIDERIYAKQIALLTAKGSTTQDLTAPPPPSYVTHYWKFPPPNELSSLSKHLTDFNSVTLFESRTTIESGTTGLRTWRASYVLAQFLIARPNLLTGRRVLELGSGAGFLGLVMASIQMLYDPGGKNSTLCLTDVNEDVLSRCSENINLPCNASSSHPHISVRPLDWSDALDSGHAPSVQELMEGFDADVIVGADLLYHPDAIRPFLSTLRLALLAGGTQPKSAYLALPLRNQDLLNSFLRSAEDKFELCIEDLSSQIDNDPSLLYIPERIDREVIAFKVTLKR